MGTVSELETPVLNGIVGTTTELERIDVVATPVLRFGRDVVPVPAISEVETETVLAGEPGIEVELW